jgi:hypothetical protein
MTLDDFFNLDLDLDLDLSDVIVEEKEEEVSPAPLFRLDDFATWYPSKEVYAYLIEGGIAKSVIPGALRALLIDQDINKEEEVISYLLDVVISGNDLVYYTQKTPRLDALRPSKSKTLSGYKVSLLANLIRNALLGIDF